jgi:hypothetical protein
VPVRKALPLLIPVLLPSLSLAACIPFDQARNHLDETQCVTGKVTEAYTISIFARPTGFAHSPWLCFRTILQKIGDIRQLAGKVVEIKGEIKDYDDRAEIVLESSKQLGNGLMRLSPLPKSFDVEQRGYFSARTSRPPHKRSTRKKKGIPNLPADVSDTESD